jgi:hypothetical protein
MRELPRPQRALKMTITTIQLDSKTRELLKAQKRGGESYDQLIVRLIYFPQEPKEKMLE